MQGQFRLLPLLIFIAVIAFSVRLAEIITGISHLSGSAFAESAEKKEPEKAHDPAKLEDVKPAEDPAKDVVKDEKKEDGKPQESTTTEEDKKSNTPEWRDAGDSDLDVSSVKMEVMEDVARRSTKLDQQENSLNAREALLKATELEIDRKYQEMTKLRTEIEGLLGKQTEEEVKRIVSLVKIYEGMKPKEAARIFDTLDLDILVSVVSKMSERKISPILGLMTPERAKTLTIMLAEQKQLPTLNQ